MSMNFRSIKEPYVKGTDSNRFMWTASFPTMQRQTGLGRMPMGTGCKGLPAFVCVARNRNISYVPSSVVPGRVELPTSTLSV
mgnify:CR=1 FL=1